jgi:hypothetical protein
MMPCIPSPLLFDAQLFKAVPALLAHSTSNEIARFGYFLKDILVMINTWRDKVGLADFFHFFSLALPCLAVALAMSVKPPALPAVAAFPHVGP